MQASAMAYAHLLAFRSMSLEANCSNGVNAVAIRKLQRLFTLECIQNDAGWFLANNAIPCAQGMDIAKERNSMCKEIGPLLPYFVDAFGIPKKIVHAPIAKDWIEANRLPSPHARL